jgi:hypothetical protein
MMNYVCTVFNVNLDALIAIPPGKTPLHASIHHNNHHLEPAWKTALDQKSRLTCKFFEYDPSPSSYLLRDPGVPKIAVGILLL